MRRLPALRLFHSSPQVLQHLDVSQNGRELVIEVRLRPGLRVHGLWAHCADTGQWWTLSTPVDGTTGHQMVIDLLETAARLPELKTTIGLFLDVEHDVVAGSADTAVRAPLSVLNNSPAEATHARYRMRLGMSVDTRIANLHAVSDAGRSIAPYPTRGGNLALALNYELKPFADVHVKRISVRDGVLQLRGRLLRHLRPGPAAGRRLGGR